MSIGQLRYLVCYVNWTNAIWSTWLQSPELLMPLTLGAISFTMSTGQKRSINQCFKQDTIHTATIPWTFNATTTGAGRYLVCHVNLTIAIYWSMSQTGYDPLFYNPVNFQHNYHWALSRLWCQPDNSDLLINVSNRIRSTLLQSRELSTSLPLGAISFAVSTGQ